MNSHEIGKRLRKHRTSDPHVSLACLAEETKVLTVSRISNYEQGIRLLKANEAQTIAAAFTRLGKPISAARLLGIEEVGHRAALYAGEDGSEKNTRMGTLSKDEEILVMKYRQMPSAVRTQYQEIGNTLTSKKVNKIKKSS